MKKLLLSISLFSSFLSWSQSDKSHELKIDALQALVVPAIEISYEYAANSYSGIGASVYFRLDEPNDEYQKFAFTPYYRQYFYDNREYGLKGFYIEAFLQYTIGEDDTEVIDPDNNIATINSFTSTDSYNDLGIGFGGGVKWLSSNGFSVDIGAGLGRNFKIDNNSPDFFFRWGISLGYRFL